MSNEFSQVGWYATGLSLPSSLDYLANQLQKPRYSTTCYNSSPHFITKYQRTPQ